METNIFWVVFSTFLTLLGPAQSRIHKLHLTNTEGPLVPLSSFGLLQGGSLSISLGSFSLRPDKKLTSNDNIGFTIVRSTQAEAEQFPPTGIDDSRCALSVQNPQRLLGPHVEVVLDLKNGCVRIRRSADMPDVTVFGSSIAAVHNDSSVIVRSRKPRSTEEDDYGGYVLRDSEGEEISPWHSLYIPRPRSSETAQVQHRGRGRSRTHRKMQEQMIEALPPASVSNETSEVFTQTPQYPSTTSVAMDNTTLASTAVPRKLTKGSCINDASHHAVPLVIEHESDGITISATLTLHITSEDMEGMYYVRFHNCLDKSVLFDTDVVVIEKNYGNNYLTASEIPLPFIYSAAAAIFFIGGIIWMCLLCNKGVVVYKLHCLMVVPVLMKCVILLFRAEDYSIVQSDGVRPGNFSISVMITVFREASFVLTAVLAASGYYFMRHLIPCKHTLILFLVASAQIAAHVASVVIRAPEEAQDTDDQPHSIFFSIDLVSYTALLFPVIWSLYVLRDGRKKDGDRKKLRLFCRTCSLIIFYIYFTRIFIELVIKSSVPFQYTWICKILREAGSFLLFALTGYWFRPVPSGVYARLKLLVPDESKEDSKFPGLGLPVWSKKPAGVKDGRFKLYSDSEGDDDDDEHVLLDKTFYLSGAKKHAT